MRIRKQFTLTVLIWIYGTQVATDSFIIRSSSSSRQKSSLSTFYDDFEELEEPNHNNNNKANNRNSQSPQHESNNNDINDNNDSREKRKSDETIKDTDAAIYAALKARQASLFQQQTSNSNNNNQRSSSSGGQQTHHSNSLQDPFLVSWLEASTVPAVRIILDDWIRRMAIHRYPLMVCGSANGNLYLVDLQRGEELDCLLQLHAAQSKNVISSSNSEEEGEGGESDEISEQDKEALQYMYGRFDGGGVIAIAMKDDIVASSGREGGVHICTLVGHEQRVAGRHGSSRVGGGGAAKKQMNLKLQRQGKIRGLELNTDENSLITSLVFDEDGTLWVGGYSGILRGYDTEDMDADNRPLMLRQRRPSFEVDLESPILSLSVNDEIGCGVATTSQEGIILFSLDDGEVIGGWNPFVSSARDEYARSAVVFQSDPEGVWSVVIGGSRGSLFQRRLNVDRFGTISTDHSFQDQVDDATFPLKMLPAHSGAVLAMDSPLPGILVTGAQDGSMRVWDCSPDADEEDVDGGVGGVEEPEANYDDIQPNDSRPRCLYSLSGYKVWLGSIFASPRKLVSDGNDNTIIVHSFDEEEEDILFKDDDEEDFEGFNFE